MDNIIEKIKVLKSDFFGRFSGVSLCGVTLTQSNIDKYALIKIWDDENYSIYKITKKWKFVIRHDKRKGDVDWYDDDDSYKNGYQGEPFDGYPDEFWDKSLKHWIKKFN